MRIADAIMRRWCETLSKTLEVQRIAREGKPYLDRYFAAGWSPTNRRVGQCVYLHHFLASDPETTVHSHPWDYSVSVILAGGYRETRCSAEGVANRIDYWPGDINVLRADDRHRIELLAPDCWTLFMAGCFEKP